MIRIESAKAKVENEREINGPSRKIENVPSRETKDPSQRIVVVVLRNAGKFLIVKVAFIIHLHFVV